MAAGEVCWEGGGREVCLHLWSGQGFSRRSWESNTNLGVCACCNVSDNAGPRFSRAAGAKVGPSGQHGLGPAGTLGRATPSLAVTGIWSFSFSSSTFTFSR